ncbi:MAG: DsbA family protein [Acidobacteriota bacterium]|nr:DsbA family protein [Acidobacteriota bacterium]
MKRNLFIVTCLILILGFWFGASQLKKQRAEKLGFLAQERASTFVRPHSPALGAEDAGVYLVEFTDPACETCAAFSPFVKQFMDRNPGKIRLVIRYAPFHEGSSDVVRVLEAARMQGKYWETLDLLYRSQNMWTQHHQVRLDQVWRLLPAVGLDLERLRADMRDPSITAIIGQDLADAETLGVRLTPGFFVNGTPLEPFGLEPLAALINAELSEAYPG